jgi:anti-anti-sigma regulatory factor
MTAEHSDCNTILNSTNVDIITSSGLTRLLMWCQIILYNIHPFTKSAFEVTGLDGVFTLAADKPAAMAILRSNWPALTL